MKFVTWWMERGHTPGASPTSNVIIDGKQSMSQLGKTDAGQGPGASGNKAGKATDGHTPADGHVSGGTASSTPAPGESKGADPSDREA